MLEKLTSEDFQAHLNEIFTIRVDDTQQIELRLTSVTNLGEPRGPRFKRAQAFSLIFLGPKDLYLPQQICRLENEHMGVLEIFVVPVGRDEDGFHYEAIFN